MTTCPTCQSDAISESLQDCPYCESPLAARSPTLIEPTTAEEGLGQTMMEEALAEIGTDVLGTTQTEEAPFRPKRRPPMAALFVVDDGGETAERVRIRSDEFIVGRDCDGFSVPHDAGLSKQHFCVQRTRNNGVYRWTVSDLASTNGTFARVRSSSLEHEQEIRIGHSRIRFECEAAAASTTPHNGTMAWQVQPLRDGLLESAVLFVDGCEQPVSIRGGQCWLGRADANDVTFDDDTVAGRHARIFQDDRGEWQIEDQGSVNGTWVRIETTHVTSAVEILAGEQVFRLGGLVK